MVTLVVRCKSREANKVVNAFRFQILLSETRTYLWHLYYVCMGFSILLQQMDLKENLSFVYFTSLGNDEAGK